MSRAGAWRSAFHSRLHWRIYLAVLASVGAVAVLAAMAWHFAGQGEVGTGLGTAAEIAGEILPGASAPHDQQRDALARWHGRTHASFALFSPARGLVASAGQPLPAPPPDLAASGLFRAGFGGPVFALHLPDGRWLVVRHAHRGTAAFGFLTLLVLVAAVVAVIAWPVSRRLTRRLGRLEEGVDAFGAGDLAVRVGVEGRDETARLAVAFNRAAARIETLVASQKRLLQNASHELRSPLARLRMAAALVDGDAKLKEEIARNVGELDGLVEEILLASRLEAGGEEDLGRGEPVDLTGLAAEESARAGASFAGDVVTVNGNPRLLRRMVRNLVENAQRHGGGGPVEVRVVRGTPGAVLEVSDRGPGVPDDSRERIFEPFYRLPSPRDGDGGTGSGVGLGLSLSRQVARHHGGDVVCLPRDGGGSRFRVTLR